MESAEEAQRLYDHATQQEMFARRAYEVAIDNVAFRGVRLEVARRREEPNSRNSTDGIPHEIPNLQLLQGGLDGTPT